ncbi:hypothetical protein PPM_p0286 (plasmid) [Paenibacillus polymyxa M1]|uniref:hypothetical protein n=2 Tax=Paenibacillus polymyxa TaxID=1406 RepID=UPI00021BBAA8|nr:hypothetical protein [Paenibacillus polymyxa]CCC86436.1 hypothetical protein PPM_p0286 [Paenibacillus polymyxa M1]
MMKKKTLTSILAVPLVVAAASGFFYLNTDRVVSAQSETIAAADKATNSQVEYIKISVSSSTYSDSSYQIRIRDRKNLSEVTEDYVGGVLQNKIIVSEEGKRVTSIGRDHITGKLVGNTWILPVNLANENKRILNISLMEEQKKEMKNQNWVKSLRPQSQSKDASLQEVVAEDKLKKETVTIDTNTGLPVKREVFVKDKEGNWTEDSVRVEEYKYLNSMPMNLQKLNDEVEIKEITAPIKEDKLFKG